MINPKTGLEDPNYTGESPDDVKNPKPASEELTPELMAKAFEHPRFKELTKAAKELKELQEKLKKDDDAKLKEKEEYKTLAEQKEAEVAELKKQIGNQNKKQAIITQAIAQGVRKEALDDVVKLVDLEQVLTDDTGAVTNASDVIKNLLVAKSYLLADPKQTNLGTPNIGGAVPTGKIWKFSEWQSQSRNHKYYEANKADFEQAKAEGRVNFSE